MTDVPSSSVRDHGEASDEVKPNGCADEVGRRTDGRTMNRKDRNDFLERLMVYRRVYHLRGPYDTEPTLSVGAIVALGEQLMRAMHAGAGSGRLS
jgi:hypothetical protein